MDNNVKPDEATGATEKAAPQDHVKMPAAGPHARPELTNYDACPGSGVLPGQTEAEEESDPGAG